MKDKELRIAPQTIRSRRDAGFSVVELMVVLALVGIAMIPLAGVQFGSRRQVTQADRMSQATQIAMSQVETAKMVGFGNAQVDTLTEGPFTAVTSVAPDSTNPFLEEIQVRVSWNANGQERQVFMAVKQSAR